MFSCKNRFAKSSVYCFENGLICSLGVCWTQNWNTQLNTYRSICAWRGYAIAPSKKSPAIGFSEIPPCDETACSGRAVLSGAILRRREILKIIPMSKLPSWTNHCVGVWSGPGEADVRLSPFCLLPLFCAVCAEEGPSTENVLLSCLRTVSTSSQGCISSSFVLLFVQFLQPAVYFATFTLTR